jgi:hypothetical protein
MIISYNNYGIKSTANDVLLDVVLCGIWLPAKSNLYYFLYVPLPTTYIQQSPNIHEYIGMVQTAKNRGGEGIPLLLGIIHQL